MTESGIGDRYQIETKYYRDRMPGGRLNLADKPETYKTYPDTLKILLSAPVTVGGAPIWEVIQSRRSERLYLDRPMAEADLSQLLWAAQGITAERVNMAYRAAPSAGALYPVETYLVVHKVEDIEPGVYHYDVRNHQLEQLRRGEYRLEVAQAALDQRLAFSANAVFVWTAIFPRSKWKYKQRAYRYVYLDAGHIAQNLALAAVALGLGSCQVAALFDDEANALLGVDGEEESVIYMTTVGRPKQR